MDIEMIERQLNEIPPTRIVEQLARIYGEEIMDVGCFEKLAYKRMPKEYTVLCVSCKNCFNFGKSLALVINGEISHNEVLSFVNVYKRYFHDKQTAQTDVVWVGRCERCKVIYWFWDLGTGCDRGSDGIE